MRRNSLALRLVVSSAIVAIVLLVSAAILLASLFQAALERNFDARLRAVMDGLLANVEVNADGSPAIQSELADTRFTLPLSGWYWQVTSPARGVADLASPSLLEKRLQPTAADLADRDEEGLAHFYLIDANGTRLRAIEQRYKLYDKADQYSFMVAGNFDTVRKDALELVAARFRALSEPTRLRLLNLLMQGEHTVGQLVEAAGLGREDLTYLAAATTQGDYLTPGHAAGVHGELGAGPLEIASFQSVCGSSLMAAKAAWLSVRAGEAQAAAACAGEFSSRWFRPEFYEETALVEDAFDQHFEGREVGHNLPALDRLPRREVLEAACERTHRRARAVGDDGDCVRCEERWDVVAIGLELVPRALEGRVLVGRVLQLEESERDAIDDLVRSGAVRQAKGGKA